MDTQSLLHTNYNSIRQCVLEKLEKNENQVKTDKEILRKFIKENKTNIPEDPGDNCLELFLIINKFNIEKCKKKLETYYTIRRKIPDLYVDKNPRLKHMQEIADMVYCIPLPILTQSLSRVILIKIKDSNVDNFHAYNFFAHTFNVTEIRLREDIVVSDTILYDWEGIRWGHCLKMTPVHLKKASSVLEKVFSSRVEGIHHLNINPNWIKFINLAKSMLKEKIRKRVHIHKNLESLYKHLPKEVLPEDYGGYCQPLSILHGLWKQKFVESQHIFDNLEKIQTQLGKKSGQQSLLELELPTNFGSLELD